MKKNQLRDLIENKFRANHILDFLLSLLFVLIYFESTKEWKYAKLEDLTNFSAHNPFQYRVLIPSIANLIIKTLPGFSYIFAYQLILLTTTFMLVRFTRLFIKEYFKEELYINVGIIVLFYILFWNYAALGIWLHPADIPAILFFLLGLIFIKKNKFKTYYPIFILACFNRESIILILIVYLLTRKNFKEVLYNSYIIILYTLTWLIIKFTLYHIFQNNPAEISDGHIFLLKFYENLEFLSGLVKLDKFYFLRIFAFGAIYFFIPHILKSLDQMHKRLLLLIPFYIVIIFFFGKFQEIRVFSELVPLFVVPGILLVKEYLVNKNTTAGNYYENF